MGTVHLLQEAQTPKRIRQRFDLAVASFEESEVVGSRPLSPVLVSGGIYFEAPWETAGRLTDDATRQLTLFWLSLFRQQLRFYRLAP